MVADSIFHDPETKILFANFKYVGYDWDGDSKIFSFADPCGESENYFLTLRLILLPVQKMRENPKVQEWWRMTDSFQESFVPGAKSSYDPPGWWKGLEEVFYIG